MGNTAQQHRIAIGCFQSSSSNRKYKRSSSRSASECILDIIIVILLCLAFEGMTLCLGLMLLLLAGDIEENPGPMGDQAQLEGQANDKIKNVMLTCPPEKELNNKLKLVESKPSILSLDNISDQVSEYSSKSSQLVDNHISFGDFKRELNENPTKILKKKKV